MKKIITSCIFFAFACLCMAQESVIQQWSEKQLFAIRNDFARPPVQARNLFHVSVAMYDAWAAYDDEAEPYLLGKTVAGYTCPFNGIPDAADVEEAREEAISYAAYRMLRHRYQFASQAANILPQLDALMAALEFDISITSMDYSTGSPAALGNYIASQVIQYGLQDGANEAINYINTYYSPVNTVPLAPVFSGNPTIIDPNRWQPLSLSVFIDQNGDTLYITQQAFQAPEWGNVTPFAMTEDDADTYVRDGDTYVVYHDPGGFPQLDTAMSNPESDLWKWNFSLVSTWSSHLDPSDGVMWDVSPASIGNNTSLPTTFEGHQQFYNMLDGGDPGQGHDLNPHTGQPYEPQIVPRGDYVRVLAEFWADGPSSETPPGHWYSVLHKVSDDPNLVKKFNGKGEVLGNLEWDAKTHLALGGAVHDAAITAWGIKGWYDGVRPISAIRYMAEKGQASDPNLPNYHPAGFNLIPGYIEQIQFGDPLAGFNNVNVGEIKIKAWQGDNSTNSNITEGAGWILAKNWWPYQRPTFVTPPFAGYISGHSTYSRSAAEMMTHLTGDPYFPGGMGTFPAPQNQFLVFEEGPSVDIELQWATYRDASDQCSLSRIWGSIHPPMDDIPGRLAGITIGADAFDLAKNLFYNDADNDGFFSYDDCNDADAAINPNATEICDGVDNNCNGVSEEGLIFTTYYTDQDGDGFGGNGLAISTCETTPPTGYSADNLDCNDTDAAIHPGAAEVCDAIDNDCNTLADDGLAFTTWYGDADGDAYGSSAVSVTDCQAAPPTGYTGSSGDCDDANPAIHPAAIEVCDGVDNNCNNVAEEGLTFFTYFQDSDGDTYGNQNASFEACETAPPVGYVTNNGDCDDTNAANNPDALEVPLDLVDNDCDGDIDETSAVNDLSKKSLKVFPNPTNGSVTLRCEYTGTMNVQVSRTDGRIAQHSVLTFSNGSATLSLDALTQGVYLVSFSDEHGNRLFAKRIVKI